MKIAKRRFIFHSKSCVDHTTRALNCLRPPASAMPHSKTCNNIQIKTSRHAIRYYTVNIQSNAHLYSNSCSLPNTRTHRGNMRRILFVCVCVWWQGVIDIEVDSEVAKRIACTHKHTHNIVDFYANGSFLIRIASVDLTMWFRNIVICMWL